MTEERLWEAFRALSAVVKRLRADCPWDRKQTHLSLRRYLLEESFEALEALDAEDADAVRGELGDLLFQVWFHAEIASEQGAWGFDLADVLDGIRDKLVHRHPHVFGDVEAPDPETVKRNWEQIKLAEGRASILEGMPLTLPALAAAQARQDKVAAVGFDWSRAEDVAAKVREEVGELLEAAGPDGHQPGSDGTDRRHRHLRHELGDVLFSVVNFARHLGLDAEACLREANARFERRFRHIEEGARQDGRALKELSLEEMDALWREAKRNEPDP